MNENDLQSLAAAWVAFWDAPEGSSKRDSVSWVSDQEWELIRKSPKDGWNLILAILHLDLSTQIQQVLAAGPLEDLLSHHGESMIAVVEQEARINPRFAALLGGVWQNSMSDEVWSRVRAAWNRQGWVDEA